MTELTDVRSGWCSAPAGMRPHHEACRWPECQCRCHQTDDREDKQ